MTVDRTTIRREQAKRYRLKKRVLDLLTDIEDKALDAVSHVGAANYAEREREARQWVRDAVQAARVAIG